MSTEQLCIGLTEVHARSLLNNNDTFLFDCDGVLWNFPEIFTGAIELLNYLTEKVLQYLVLYVLVYRSILFFA